MKRNAFETLIGALVLAVAVTFFYFAYQKVAVSTVSGYPVYATFSDIGSLTEGAEVRIGGIKVGNVVATELDQAYFARVTLAIESGVELTTDTFAQISSDGLLGDPFVRLEPGGEETIIASGDDITYTEGAFNIVDIVKQAVFSPGTSE